MRKIRAISLHQPWAAYIAEGLKTIETRTWETNCRGDILICSTKKTAGNIPAGPRFPKGKALAVVELYGCRRMLKRDEEAAMCPYEGGRWSWLIRNIRKIERPFDVRGRQGIFTVEMTEEKG